MRARCLSCGATLLCDAPAAEFQLELAARRPIALANSLKDGEIKLLITAAQK